MPAPHPCTKEIVPVLLGQILFTTDNIGGLTSHTEHGGGGGTKPTSVQLGSDPSTMVIFSTPDDIRYGPNVVGAP